MNIISHKQVHPMRWKRRALTRKAKMLDAYHGGKENRKFSESMTEEERQLGFAIRPK